MSGQTTEIGALAICSAAWLIAAICLILDPAGWLPFWPRRITRGVRVQAAAGLTLMTAVVLTQIAGLRDWPRLARGTLDILDMVLGLGAIAVAVITAARGSAPIEADHAAASGPGPSEQ